MGALMAMFGVMLILWAPVLVTQNPAVLVPCTFILLVLASRCEFQRMRRGSP